MSLRKDVDGITDEVASELLGRILTIRPERQQGNVVPVNCPHCKARNTPAQSYETVEVIRFLNRFPLWSRRHTFLVCNACKGSLVADIPIASLDGLTCDELERHILARVEMWHAASAVFAIITCWVPFIGLPAALIAILVNRRVPRWTKTVGFVALAVGILSTGLVLAAMAVEAYAGRMTPK